MRVPVKEILGIVGAALRLVVPFLKKKKKGN